MGDRKKPVEAQFNPPHAVFRAVVTSVSPVGVHAVTVRYRATTDGPGGAEGCTMIDSGDDGWPGAYWPPAEGDVIRVAIAPVVTLEARPR